MAPSFELRTPRLTIRHLGAIEPQLLCRYLVENRQAHREWEPTRPDDAYTLASIKARLAAGEPTPGKSSECRFALLSPGERELLGLINFSNIAGFPFQACHLGFSLDKKHEGLGLMREGLKTTISFMFDLFDLNRVMANFIPRNVRSARLLMGLGFRVEGLAKDYLCIDGRWQDHMLTSVLRSDWLSAHPAASS